MARAIKRKPIDIRDVVDVYRMYNRAWREHVRFPTKDAYWDDQPRLSDIELWNNGMPAVQSRGTMGDGFAELEFTFRDQDEAYAEQWTKNFLGHHKLPYTYFNVRPARNLKGLIRYKKGEHIPEYVRVIVRFEEDEVFNKRAKELREASYHDPKSVDNIAKLYTKKLFHYSYGLHMPDDGPPKDTLELGGVKVRVGPVSKNSFKSPWDGEENEYVFVSFLFYAKMNPEEAQALVRNFMEELRLPVTFTDWELEPARYDEDRVHIYKPIRVYAMYNPRGTRSHRWNSDEGL